MYEKSRTRLDLLGMRIKKKLRASDLALDVIIKMWAGML